VEILFLHPGGLGDIILSLPAIELFRNQYPAARITLAANLDYAAPILGVCVDRAVSLNSLPLHILYSEEPLPDRDMDFWKSFDGIVSWTGAGDSGFVRRLKSVHPNARIAAWKPDPRDPRHVSQIFIDSLGFGIDPGIRAEPMLLRPNSGQSQLGSNWLIDRGWTGTDSLVALHPGAGAKSKRWPPNRFAALARNLALRQNSQMLIVEGPAEPGLAAEVAGEIPDLKPIIARNLPLNVLAAVLEKTVLFVGNDSGIAHLAAALSICSVVLFGPTLPRHWAPLGRDVSVLWKPQDRLESIKVEDVMQLCLRAFASSR